MDVIALNKGVIAVMMVRRVLAVTVTRYGLLKGLTSVGGQPVATCYGNMRWLGCTSVKDVV